VGTPIHQGIEDAVVAVNSVENSILISSNGFCEVVDYRNNCIPILANQVLGTSSYTWNWSATVVLGADGTCFETGFGDFTILYGVFVLAE
jgi:hypothetical protein